MADVNLTTNLRYYLPSLPERQWFCLTSKHKYATDTKTRRSRGSAGSAGSKWRALASE